MSVTWRRCYKEVSVIRECPLLGGVRNGEVSIIRKCPLLGGFRYGEVSVMRKCPLLRGVRYKKSSPHSQSKQKITKGKEITF